MDKIVLVVLDLHLKLNGSLPSDRYGHFCAVWGMMKEKH
jgi:hypothetical protein